MNKRIFDKNKLLWAIQLSIASVSAFFFADQFHLAYSSSAAIISMLATITWETKKHLLRSTLEWYTSISFATVLALIMEITCYKLSILLILLILFFTALLHFEMTDCMVISTVIIMQYFMTGKLTYELIVNEFLLLTVGIISAYVFQWIARRYISLKNNI